MRGILTIARMLVCIHGMAPSFVIADEGSDLEQIELEIKLREISEKSYSIAYERAVRAIGNSSLEKQRTDLANKSLPLRDKARNMRKKIVENNDLVANKLTGLPESCFDSFQFLSPEYNICEEKYSHVFSLVLDHPELQKMDLEADDLLDDLMSLTKKIISIREKFTKKFYVEEMRKELEQLKMEVTKEILEREMKEFFRLKYTEA